MNAKGNHKSNYEPPGTCIKQKCMRDRETVNIVWLINKHTLPYKDDVGSFNGILHQHEKNHFACMVSTAGIRRDKMLLNT